MAGKQASLLLAQLQRNKITDAGTRKWIISKRGFATIILSPNDYVWGTVLLLNANDEQRLDRFEGDNYIKSVLRVDPDGTGLRTKPGVLVYIDKETASGSPGDPYIAKLKEAMKDGKAKGIPNEYFETYWKPFVPILFPGPEAVELDA